jgi:hypothetical protein
MAAVVKFYVTYIITTKRKKFEGRLGPDGGK